MAKYLVTGGAGFIGSNLVKKLLQKRERVVALDNFSSGRKENIKEFFKNSNFKFVRGDLRKPKDVEKAISGADFIIHLAATSSVEISISNPTFAFENNVIGTLNLLDIARRYKKIKKIVFASTAGVYGESSIPQKESAPTSPISPYALSKLTGEKLCRVFSEIYKVPTICLRYFNVFGPYRDPHSEYSGVISKFISNFLKNKRPIIFGDGKQVRDFIFVDDVVEATLKAANSKFHSGEIFNVASGKSISILELIEILNEIFSRDVKPIFKEEKPGDIKFSYADIKKIKESLSWYPKTEVKEGLFKTIEWFKKNERI